MPRVENVFSIEILQARANRAKRPEVPPVDLPDSKVIPEDVFLQKLKVREFKERLTSNRDFSPDDAS